MKIKVGKSYKTRDGRKVTIVGRDVSFHKDSFYRYLGRLKQCGGNDKDILYSEDGRASLTGESNLDIIAPWEEASINTDDYDALRNILNRAYDQAASGKGKERHANDKPFNQQPIAEIGRMVGTGYNLGQVMKKAQEAQGMANRRETDAAVRELLGVIVYAASAIMLWEEKE